MTTELLLPLGAFAIVALSARQIGELFVRLHLPRITGFLMTGIVAGHYLLGLISEEQVHRLVFLDEIALAFIAFVAGSELHLEGLRSRLRSITLITAGIVAFTLVLVTAAFFALAGRIDFVSSFSPSARLGVALLAGTVLVARSPSSAIAIINEVRAHGPFTRTVLGVTVVMDVVVIALFAFSIALADMLLTDVPFGPRFVVLLIVELLIILELALLLWGLLRMILAMRLGPTAKIGLLLAAGFLSFVTSGAIRQWSYDYLDVELLLEPLLICLIAGFLVVNRTRHRAEFVALLRRAAPYVFVVFFTLVGASLELDVLVQAWPIALALFGVRLVAIAVGAFLGGAAAGDPARHNRVRWMGFVTQAGVALGLAQEVAVEFPSWGPDFATLIIALVVLNETVGPPLFKWALQLTGEAHARAAPSGLDGEGRALIFGVDSQSRTLARQLAGHGWSVTLACLEDRPVVPAMNKGVSLQLVAEIDRDALASLGASDADALIAMLTDDENYRLASLAYEHFGTRRLVVRLNDVANLNRFRALGALIVEPGTAIVGLLEQFVRSPSATSLLLGLDEDRDIRTLELVNRDMDGVLLRHLHLPDDVLVLSVQRNGHTIITHGYTRLDPGDEITVLGTPASLDALALRFAA